MSSKVNIVMSTYNGRKVYQRADGQPAEPDL